MFRWHSVDRRRLPVRAHRYRVHILIRLHGKPSLIAVQASGRWKRVRAGECDTATGSGRNFVALGLAPQ